VRCFGNYINPTPKVNSIELTIKGDHHNLVLTWRVFAKKIALQFRELGAFRSCTSDIHRSKLCMSKSKINLNK
jgi:hypothetical protein